MLQVGYVLAAAGFGCARMPANGVDHADVAAWPHVGAEKGARPFS